MSEVKCKICSSTCSHLFNAVVLRKYNVKYVKCDCCSFIQTEQPYWLEEAYSSAIATTDIGLLHRNLQLNNIVDIIIKRYFDVSSSFLDYAGGYGIFVRLMRDKGFNFIRQDIYCKNLFAQGFDIIDYPEIQHFEMVTAFEVFEHLEDPLEEVRKMLTYSDSILFSTELQPSVCIRAADEWWYIMPETGQHISFYSYKSLSILASSLGLKFYTNGHGLHLFTSRKFREDPIKSLNYKSIGFRIANRILNFFTPAQDKVKLPSLLEKDFLIIRNKIHS